jgi:hypothetical protein
MTPYPFKTVVGRQRSGRSEFDYYADHPDQAAIFRATMQDVSEGVANEIASILDTSTYSVAVDVGGADGALVHTLMRHNPHLRGTVLDRPEVAAAAATAAKVRGLADRTEAIGGDFFKSVPRGDLYLLRFILHDWDDGDAIRILENCRRAMKPNARLVVIEAFCAEPGEEIPVNPVCKENRIRRASVRLCRASPVRLVFCESSRFAGAHVR